MDESLWTLIAQARCGGAEARYDEPAVLAKQFNASVADVITTIDAVEYMKEYLESRDLSDAWPNWNALEFAFRQIVICRRRFSSAGDKQLFAHLAFLLLDESTPRPISRQIEHLSHEYSRVRGRLSVLATEQPEDQQYNLLLLGHQRVDATPFAISSALSEPKVRVGLMREIWESSANKEVSHA